VLITMKAFLCVVLLLTGAGAAARASAASTATRLAGAELPPIRVDVLTSPDLSESIVKEIFGETDAIWGQAGITFEWHRIISTGADKASTLEVTIDDRQRDVTPWQAALGWITFRPDGPGRSIHLSRTSVEDLLDRASHTLHAPLAAHDAMVGRALGRALSHELGHYFLSSRVHTRRGLMRAIWPSDELFAAWRGGFELTAEERVAAVRAVGWTH
jgi:hypothetical protein